MSDFYLNLNKLLILENENKPSRGSCVPYQPAADGAFAT